MAVIDGVRDTGMGDADEEADVAGGDFRYLIQQEVLWSHLGRVELLHSCANTKTMPNSTVGLVAIS